MTYTANSVLGRTPIASQGNSLLGRIPIASQGNTTNGRPPTTNFVIGRTMTSTPTQNKQPIKNTIGNSVIGRTIMTSATSQNKQPLKIQLVILSLGGQGNIIKCGKGTNKPFKAPTKQKSMAELLSVPTQSIQAIPKSPTTRNMSKAQINANSPVTRSITWAQPKTKEAPYNVGMNTCLSTEDNYYKSLGSKKGKWVTNKLKSTNQGSTTQCQGSSNVASNPIRRTLNLGGLNLGS